MSTRGDYETAKLRENVDKQLQRLLVQLGDLEEFRDELGEDEYTLTKRETLEQLEEFERSLDKMKQGDLSLVDSLNGMQLAIQAAIKGAFKNTDILAMFAKKEPAQLRQKLVEVQAAQRTKKIGKDVAMSQSVEILVALRDLGEQLSGEEEAFLTKNAGETMSQFKAVKDKSGVVKGFGK